MIKKNNSGAKRLIVINYLWIDAETGVRYVAVSVAALM